MRDFCGDMRAAPGAVVGSGRGRAGVPSRVYLRGVVVVSSALDSLSPAQQQNTSDFFFSGGSASATCGNQSSSVAFWDFWKAVNTGYLAILCPVLPHAMHSTPGSEPGRAPPPRGPPSRPTLEAN